MTWRERIQAARERGTFTREDCALAGDGNTCAVGEAHLAHGGRRSLAYGAAFYGMGADPADKPGAAFFGAVLRNHFDRAESLLNLIEDRALALKREAYL